MLTFFHSVTAKLIPVTPKIDPHDPKIDLHDPKMNLYLAWPRTSVCTKFQVDSSDTFRVMLQKPNFTFVTSVALKIKVTIPEQRGFSGTYGEAKYQVSI